MVRDKGNWKQIEEMNKAFAEFMGYIYEPFDEKDQGKEVGWVVPGLRKTHTKLLAGVGIGSPKLCRTHRDLRFHFDWSWTMALVIKINELSGMFVIRSSKDGYSAVFNRDMPYTNDKLFQDTIVKAAFEYVKYHKKEIEGKIEGKECVHIFQSVYYGSEWEVECKKCERNVFDIYTREDAVTIIREMSKE